MFLTAVLSFVFAADDADQNYYLTSCIAVLSLSKDRLPLRRSVRGSVRYSAFAKFLILFQLFLVQKYGAPSPPQLILYIFKLQHSSFFLPGKKFLISQAGVMGFSIKLIFADPVIVISITPFFPFSPYFCCAEFPFKTLID